MQSDVLEQAETACADQERQFVILTIAGQLCGIPVLFVRDVLGEQAIAPVPLAPPEVAGSLNLRGRIVTAVDLRRRLGLPPREAGAARMSAVVELRGELYALLVDQVSEVMTLSARDVEQNPPTLPASWAAVSSGIHRLAGRLLVELEVERLLALNEAA